jgi:hypothetical protein
VGIFYILAKPVQQFLFSHHIPTFFQKPAGWVCDQVQIKGLNIVPINRPPKWGSQRQITFKQQQLFTLGLSDYFLI